VFPTLKGLAALVLKSIMQESTNAKGAAAAAPKAAASAPRAQPRAAVPASAPAAASSAPQVRQAVPAHGATAPSTPGSLPTAPGMRPALALHEPAPPTSPAPAPALTKTGFHNRPAAAAGVPTLRPAIGLKPAGTGSAGDATPSSAASSGQLMRAPAPPARPHARASVGGSSAARRLASEPRSSAPARAPSGGAGKSLAFITLAALAGAVVTFVVLRVL
jgi:hypothetical protein